MTTVRKGWSWARAPAVPKGYVRLRALQAGAESGSENLWLLGENERLMVRPWDHCAPSLGGAVPRARAKGSMGTGRWQIQSMSGRCALLTGTKGGRLWARAGDQGHVLNSASGGPEERDRPGDKGETEAAEGEGWVSLSERRLGGCKTPGERGRGGSQGRGTDSHSVNRTGGK